MSLVHVPLKDGSCRLLPVGIEQAPSKEILLWTRVHGRTRFVASTGSTGTLAALEEDWPGLLTNPLWAGLVQQRLNQEIENLSADPHLATAAARNKFVFLLADCPPLAFMQPFSAVLAHLLAERDVPFFQALTSHFRMHQPKAKRSGPSKRLRSVAIAEWEAVTEYRLKHGTTRLAEIAAALARQRFVADPDKEADRIERTYNRALGMPGTFVIATAAAGCHRGATAVGAMTMPAWLAPSVRIQGAESRGGLLGRVFFLAEARTGDSSEAPALLARAAELRARLEQSTSPRPAAVSKRGGRRRRSGGKRPAEAKDKPALLSRRTRSANGKPEPSGKRKGR